MPIKINRSFYYLSIAYFIKQNIDSFVIRVEQIARTIEALSPDSILILPESLVINYYEFFTSFSTNNAITQNNAIGINIIDAQIDMRKNKKELIKVKKRIKKGIV